MMSVVSGVAADKVGMDIPVKFGDSKSNGSRDIRGADFESNERTNMTEAYHIRQKALRAFRIIILIKKDTYKTALTRFVEI